MACCIIGALILSALFRCVDALRRLVGVRVVARPDPSAWRPGTTPFPSPVPAPAATGALAHPVHVFVTAPVVIVAALAAAFQTNAFVHDLILRTGISLGIPLSQFVALCRF